MAKQRNALRAGIFMIISLGLIVFLVIAISGAAKFTESFTTYAVRFALSDDIGGLRNGDDVRIGGLKVGGVRDIKVDQENADIVVYIDIPSKYALNKDAGVAVQRGLTGSTAINIESFGSEGRATSADYLVGQPDSIAGLTHQLAALKPDLKTTLENLKIASGKLNVDLDKFGQTADSFTATGLTATTTVQNVRVRIPEIIERYESVIDAANHMLEAIHDFFGPSSADFRQVVANINAISGNLRDKLPPIMEKIHGLLAHVDVAVERASSALQDIQSAAVNLRAASASLRSILADNRGRLNEIILSLKATGDNLKDASTEIRHSPWRLLYQPKADEVANLNVYDSVRQFAEGASSLDDAAGALRDALKDPNADPEQVKKLMANLNDSFDQFQRVQDKLWKEIK